MLSRPARDFFWEAAQTLTNKTNNQSIHPSTKQVSNRAINQQTRQRNQAANRSVDQLIKPCVKETINQSINQKMNRSPSYVEAMFITNGLDKWGYRVDHSYPPFLFVLGGVLLACAFLSVQILVMPFGKRGVCTSA